MNEDVLVAFRIYRQFFHKDAEESDHAFVENGIPIKIDRLAEQLREDLQKAGYKRQSNKWTSMNLRELDPLWRRSGAEGAGAGTVGAGGQCPLERPLLCGPTGT